MVAKLIFLFLEHCAEATEFGQTILVVNQITTCITNKKDPANDDSKAKMSKVGSDPAQAPVKTSLVAVAHRWETYISTSNKSS